MKECARVVARSDNVVRFKLEHVRLASVESELMASLKYTAVALAHRVVPGRRFVKQRSAGGRAEALRYRALHSRKSARHACAAVRLRDRLVTRRAARGIRIACR